MDCEVRQTSEAGLRDAVIAWLPALVLFVLIPFAIFLPNQAEYNYNVKALFPFLLAAVFSFLLLYGLIKLIPNWMITISVGLFYLGGFFAASDILAPVPLGLLEDDTLVDSLQEAVRLTLIQLGVAAAVLVCAATLPRKTIREVGPVLVIVAAISEVFIVSTGLSPRTGRVFFESLRPPAVEAAAQKQSADKPNVYQIVLDGYSSCKFLEIVRAGDFESAFGGFTFFKANRSNYIGTFLSYPSFMTGCLFDGKSFADFETMALESGIVEELYRAGYTISFYVPGLRYVHNRTSHMSLEGGISWVETNLYRLWLVRSAPNILRQEANGLARWLGKTRRHNLEATSGDVPQVTRAAEQAGRVAPCCPTFDQFLADEGNRGSTGEYVYMHLNVPHPPYWWDAECRAIGTSDYIRNSFCATRIMSEVVRRLKELGRFDGALIIFQSDHGYELEGNDCQDDSQTPIPPEVATGIVSSTRAAVTPKDFFDRTRALLLIKPPNGARKPLDVSNAPTALVDIPATVRSLLGLPVAAGDGQSVFSINPDDSREIHFYAGYKRGGKHGGFLVLGKHFHRTDFAHFSLIHGQGWKTYPNLPVSSGRTRLFY